MEIKRNIKKLAEKPLGTVEAGRLFSWVDDDYAEIMMKAEHGGHSYSVNMRSGYAIPILDSDVDIIVYEYSDEEAVLNIFRRMS